MFVEEGRLRKWVIIVMFDNDYFGMLIRRFFGNC